MRQMRHYFLSLSFSACYIVEKIREEALLGQKCGKKGHFPILELRSALLALERHLTAPQVEA